MLIYVCHFHQLLLLQPLFKFDHYRDTSAFILLGSQKRKKSKNIREWRNGIDTKKRYLITYFFKNFYPVHHRKVARFPPSLLRRHFILAITYLLSKFFNYDKKKYASELSTYIWIYLPIPN